ncbi:LacI family DNA-binding transcriptional regulator [Pseudonocardia acaciae]|uniref:LacI family DNA-binding transcriptional regulator n=1 Tax=Pseudonocardia acaciae TaxID=551276 RepID=UPI0006876498|nr:LacI family DNA-binding transcriptional regulator [Pseudonocardia acaciae]
MATAVGVSVMTVSNAYNRPEKLSSDLRERIFATAEGLGYPGPHPTARSLRRGRAGALGVVLGESLAYAFDDPGAVAFLKGLAHACGAHEVGLHLVPTTGSAADTALIQVAAVDALVLFALPDDHPLVDAGLRRNLPILTNGGPQLPGRIFVGIDDRAAAEAAAYHLLERGHRNLAVISFPLGGTRHGVRPVDLSQQAAASFRVTRERLAGYAAAYRDAGHDWSLTPVYEVPTNSRESGRDAARAVLRDNPGTTAILAMSDELAFGALQAAAELRRAVPADLSILGFDDNPHASGATPSLTTVRQSLHDQGRLLGTIALGPPAAGPVPLHTWELVVRSSTGLRTR